MEFDRCGARRAVRAGVDGDAVRGRALTPRATLVLGLAVLGACSSDQLPDGATLAISPADWTWEIGERLDDDGRCRIDPERHVDLPMLLTLRDAQGSPIGDAEISVYATLAGNTYAGFPVLALYDDRDGNGVVSGDEELLSVAGDPVAVVHTDRYGGDRALLLRMNLSCRYRGSVIAFSDAASVIGSFEVAAVETVVPDPAGGNGGGEGGVGDAAAVGRDADARAVR